MDNYDFYDVPGLNESLSAGKNENDKEPINEKEEKKVEIKEEKEKKEEQKNNVNKDIKFEESNENMRYIKGIFKYIKTKIKFGIIIIDSSSCYKPQNIKILKEIYKVLNNVNDLNKVKKDKIEGNPIYNYLFILFVLFCFF